MSVSFDGVDDERMKALFPMEAKLNLRKCRTND